MREIFINVLIAACIFLVISAIYLVRLETEKAEIEIQLLNQELGDTVLVDYE